MHGGTCQFLWAKRPSFLFVSHGSTSLPCTRPPFNNSVALCRPHAHSLRRTHIVERAVYIMQGLIAPGSHKTGVHLGLLSACISQILTRILPFSPPFFRMFPQKEDLSALLDELHNTYQMAIKRNFCNNPFLDSLAEDFCMRKRGSIPGNIADLVSRARRDTAAAMADME